MEGPQVVTIIMDQRQTIGVMMSSQSWKRSWKVS